MRWSVYELSRRGFKGPYLVGFGYRRPFGGDGILVWALSHDLPGLEAVALKHCGNVVQFYSEVLPCCRCCKPCQQGLG